MLEPGCCPMTPLHGVSSLIPPSYCFPKGKAPGGTGITCQREGKLELGWDHSKPCLEPKSLNLAVPERQTVLCDAAVLENNSEVWNCSGVTSPVPQHRSPALLCGQLRHLAVQTWNHEQTHRDGCLGPIPQHSEANSTDGISGRCVALQKSHPSTSLSSNKE